MKNSSKKSVVILGLGSALILGVSALTIFSTHTLVNWLNVDADMQYVAAVNKANTQYVATANDTNIEANDNAGVSRTTPDDRGNENDDITVNVPSNDGTVLVSQSNGENSSTEELTVETSDTEVSADDSEAVTYPYCMGTEFVVVDPDGNMVYIVKKGDTLSEVSGLVGYSVDELAEYNHIKNVNLIYIDESLRIPANKDVVESVRKYIEGQDVSDAADAADEKDIDDATSSQQN